MIRRLLPTTAGVLAAALLWAAPAPAQYRPRPVSETELALQAGDASRDKAVALDHANDRAGAEKMWQQAADQYDQAIQGDDQMLQAAAGIAQACAALSAWARLADALAPVVLAHPEAIEPLYHRGVALARLGRTYEATVLLERVVAKGRNDLFMAQYYLGMAALSRGDGRKAVLALRAYLEQRPKELAANDAEIYERMGRAYLVLTRYVDARKAYEYALKAHPGLVSAEIGIADVLDAQGDRAAAIAYLDRVIQGGARTPPLLARQTRLLLAAGTLDRADTLAQQNVALSDSAEARGLIGEVRLAQGRLDDAAEAFRRALAMAPKQISLRVALARVLERVGRVGGAIELVQEGLASAPLDVDLWAVLGSIERRAGRLREAVAAHEKVSGLLPRSPRGRLLLAADAFAAGQWDRAVDSYQEALAVDPDDKRATTWLARALQRRARARADAGFLDEAARDLRKAFEIEHTPEMARGLGAVLLALKRPGEAKEILEPFAQLDAAGWGIPYLLGEAQLAIGQVAPASDSFERAQKLADDPAAKSRVALGWAVAKMLSGDAEDAVRRLEAIDPPPAIAPMVATNLAVARARRAVQRLSESNLSGAAQDVESLERTAALAPDVEKLLPLLRGLVRVEEGRHAEAAVAFRRFGSVDKSADPALKTFLEAYVAYRSGKPEDARKRITLLPARERKSDELARLWVASSRRAGELAYASGQLPKAEKALTDALAAAPSDSYALHNMACVQYLHGKIPVAIAAWERVAGTLPDAWLNMGIHAQLRMHEPRRAIEAYQAYLARGGWRSAMAREWKDRLEAIYGISTAVSNAGEGSR